MSTREHTRITAAHAKWELLAWSCLEAVAIALCWVACVGGVYAAAVLLG